jgi:protein subunit release factor A
MQDINEVFQKAQEVRAEMKKIRGTYREMLMQSAEYEDLKSKLENYRLRKIQIEHGIKAQLGGEFEKYEKLKKDLADFEQMMSDIALSTMLKGEAVKIESESGEFEPQFSVKFRKKK